MATYRVYFREPKFIDIVADNKDDARMDFMEGDWDSAKVQNDLDSTIDEPTLVMLFATYKGATIQRITKSQFCVTDATGTFTRTVHSIPAAKKYINSGFDPQWKEVILSAEATGYLATMMDSRKNIYNMPLGWAAMFLENALEAKQDGHDWPHDREIWNAFATIYNLDPNITFPEFQASLKK